MCRTWRSLLFYDFEIGRAPITHDVLVFIRPVPILLRNVLQLILKNVYKCGMTHDTCAIPKNRHQINDMINIRNAIHTRQFLRQRISFMVLIQYRPVIFNIQINLQNIATHTVQESHLRDKSEPHYTYRSRINFTYSLFN